MSRIRISLARRIRPVAAGLACCCGLALTLPVASRAQCVELTVAGAPGLTLFADGFESGGIATWAAPAMSAISIPATTDLAIALTVDGGLGGDHLLELRFESPGEFLYQSLTVPFSATLHDGAASERKVRIPGYPFPVAVHSPGQGARVAAGKLVIDVALPVAGTPIAQTSITGAWRVWAFLDGAEAACLAATPFLLEP